MQKKTAGAAGLAALAAGAAAVAGTVYARHQERAHTIHRKTLQIFDVPGTKEQTIVVISDLAPHGESHRHTHPGPEVGYVLEGSGSATVADKKPIVLKTGDSYQLPAGVPHVLKSGPDGVKILAVWTIEKGKPLATDVD